MTQDSFNAGNQEVWILGAAGRIGRAATARLASRGTSLVLVGRDPDILRKVAADAGAPHTGIVVADSAQRMAAEITRRRPAVVINLLGAYAETAALIARACMPGGHYVDLAADLSAIPGTLALHREAIDAGSTLVTGAGFGVLATEAVVVKLCQGRPAPDLVRVDALSSVATEPGVIGAAFAATTVDVITTGGRRFQDGQMVRTRLGSGIRTHQLPDGQSVKSASAPSGELLAAQRVSLAPNVIVTSGLAPTAPVMAAFLPALAALLSVSSVRRFAGRQLAKAKLKAAPRPRAHSWGHAEVIWPDGSRREGWLRADDGMDFTADVITETAVRLSQGAAPAGAYTPAQALGADLAVAAGGSFLLGR